MLDPALVLGTALLLGQRLPLAPWATLAVAVGALGMLWRTLRWPVRTLALASFLVAGLRAESAIKAYEKIRIATRDALGAPSRCAATVVVVGSPVWRGDGLRWGAQTSQLACEGRVLQGPFSLLLYGGPHDLARGDTVDVIAQLAPTQLFFNPDSPDPRPAAARRDVVLSGGIVDAQQQARGWGIGAWIDRARAHVRERIVATYPAEAAPLARALVLGEMDLDPGDDKAFRLSGLAHLLAVSGTHLVVVVMSAVTVLQLALRRSETLAMRGDVGRIAAAAGAVLALLYADFAGGSGSARRAAAMAVVVLVARWLGGRSSGGRALGLSMVVLAVVDPLAAFDISLLLSAAATAGLLVLSPALLRAAPRALPKPVSTALATTLAATLSCTPLLATLAPELPLLGAGANLLAVPLGEALALPLCLAHALLTPLPALEHGVALAAAGALLAVRAIAHAASSPAWAIVRVPSPTDLEGAVLALAALAVFTVAKRARAAVISVSVAALLLAEGMALRAGAPQATLRVTALDVGQGDALLVDLPDGRLWAMDGGGIVGSPLDVGEAVVAPVLRARRRKRIDILALSHPHPDHFLGLASIVHRSDIGELWDTGQGEDEGAGPAYAALLASLRTRGVAIRRPSELCGPARDIGGAQVQVLAPCPSFTPFANANDNSLVVRITYGERSALLLGDAEKREEQSLVAAYGRGLHADLLKLGHHGSRTSSSRALLDAAQPSLAVISCGARNRFGHPHATTLATLAAARIPFARTDRGGAVIWQTDGRETWSSRAYDNGSP